MNRRRDGYRDEHAKEEGEQEKERRAHARVRLRSALFAFRSVNVIRSPGAGGVLVPPHEMASPAVNVADPRATPFRRHVAVPVVLTTALRRFPAKPGEALTTVQLSHHVELGPHRFWASVAFVVRLWALARLKFPAGGSCPPYPLTQTQTVAPRTTVIATMRITPMTGLTAESFECIKKGGVGVVVKPVEASRVAVGDGVPLRAGGVAAWRRRRGWIADLWIRRYGFVGASLLEGRRGVVDVERRA